MLTYGEGFLTDRGIMQFCVLSAWVSCINMQKSQNWLYDVDVALYAVIFMHCVKSYDHFSCWNYIYLLL